MADGFTSSRNAKHRVREGKYTGASGRSLDAISTIHTGLRERDMTTLMSSAVSCIRFANTTQRMNAAICVTDPMAEAD